MNAPLEFWFDFASTYSYIAAMRIEQSCRAVNVPLAWKPFLLGPIFALQGWDDSHFNINPRRGAYMWRDMERLTTKLGLPWRKPSAFPRASTLATRVAAAHADAPWIGDYVRRTFVASFGEDRDISDRAVVAEILAGLGIDAEPTLHAALSGDRRARLRENTDSAVAIGIFGAPNCIVNGELFWGEEAVDDAIAWLLGGKDESETLYTRVDHVALAMPVGGEQAARAFYCDALGFSEMPKPVELRERGGAWFRRDGVTLHLGVDLEFKPAKKAHPALRCARYAELVALLSARDLKIHFDELLFEGKDHCFVADPFGNRIELIAE